MGFFRVVVQRASSASSIAWASTAARRLSFAGEVGIEEGEDGGDGVLQRPGGERLHFCSGDVLDRCTQASQVLHPGCDSADGARRDAALGELGTQGGEDADGDLERAVGGDLGEGVADVGVAVALQQGLPVGRQLGCGQRDVRAGLVPPLLDPGQAAGVVDRVRHRLVPEDRRRVGQQGVGAVEERELAALERRDVVDDAGAGRVPGRTAARELALDHPFAERLGGDRGFVDRAGGGQHGGLVFLRRGRGDAVDHGGAERDVGCDPADEARIHLGGELGDDGGQHLAVVGEVVAGDDGELPGEGGTAAEQPGNDPAGCRRHRGLRVGPKGLDVGDDAGVREVEVAVRAAQVAGLRHRQGHDGQPRAIAGRRGTPRAPRRSGRRSGWRSPRRSRRRCRG